MGSLTVNTILQQLTRHLAELNQQLSVKEATLQDLEADYAKWSWVIVRSHFRYKLSHIN